MTRSEVIRHIFESANGFIRHPAAARAGDHRQLMQAMLQAATRAVEGAHA